MWGPSGVVTAARVDIVTSDNVTWEDAFQFDPPAMTGCPPPPYWPCGATGPTWTFAGQNFLMEIKGNRGQTMPTLSLDSGPTGSTLFVVDDSVNRILHANVPQAVLIGQTGATGATGIGLLPGEYPYNFIMYDGSNPSVRVMLMQGQFIVQHGV